jgi:ribA/ribD-fused uncharacterized protein
MELLTVNDVIAHHQVSALTYLFFWGSRRNPNVVDKGCFSQWDPVGFHDDDGVFYATAEHYMMVKKAQCFQASDLLIQQILSAPSPSEAKNMGRSITHYQDEKWEAVRLEHVIQGNCYKFGQHPDLLDFLLSTGSCVLVEASPADSIWGIGLRSSDPRALEPRLWQGRNLLGFALMATRTRLRALLNHSQDVAH